LLVRIIFKIYVAYSVCAGVCVCVVITCKSAELSRISSLLYQDFFQSENSFYINWETKNSILNIELTFIETTYQMVHNQFNLEEFGL